MYLKPSMLIFSQRSLGVLTIHLNSDMNFPEFVQTPQTPPPQMPGATGIPRLPTLKPGRPGIWGSCDSPSSSLEHLTELRRVLYLRLLAYFKGYNSGIANGKETWWKGGWGLRRASMPSPGAPPSQHLSVLACMRSL